MKNVLFIAILFVIIGCEPKGHPTVIKMTNSEVVAKFSHETTQAEMDKLVKDLKDKYDANLSFDGSRYFDDGKLRDVKFKLSLPNGAGGSASALLATLQYSYFGFELDVKDGVAYMRKTGNVK